MYKNVKTSINVRPLKFVYFYTKGDLASLEEISKYVNTQWGGIYNFIIPVFPNARIYPFYKYFLKQFEPDYFISTLTKETELSFLKYLSDFYPHRKIFLQNFFSFIDPDISPHPLDIINYDESAPIRLLTPRINDVPNQRLLQLAIYGEIYPGQLDAYAKMMHIQNYQDMVEFEQNVDLQFSVNPLFSPINFTSINIKTLSISGGFFGSANIYDIIVGDDETAIIYFWNLRALREACQFKKDNEYGRRVLLLTTSILKDDQRFHRFFELMRFGCDTEGERCNLNLCFSHIQNSKAKLLRKKLETIDFIKKFEGGKISSTYGHVKSAKDNSFLTYSVVSPIWLTTKYKQGINIPYTSSQDFNIGLNDIHFSFPKDFSLKHLCNVAVDIDTNLWASFPKTESVANNIRRNSYFSHYGLTSFSTIGFSPSNIQINIPDEWMRLKLFFEENGYKIKPSKISKYSETIIELIGGKKNLSLFNNDIVLKLLDMLAIKSSHKIAQKISRQLNSSKTTTGNLESILNEILTSSDLKGIPKTYDEISSDERFKVTKTTCCQL